MKFEMMIRKNWWWFWWWLYLLLIILSLLVDIGHQEDAPIPMMTTFDATWDAMKCAMKISLIQLSKYHNNQMSCCGLWMAKWFIKTQAEQYCERPDGAKAIFDQVINEDLIYNQMVRSVLGDPTLSCQKFPEGSATCTRMWIMIAILIATGVAFMLFMFCGCCCITIFWCRTRRENYQLRAKINNNDSNSKNIGGNGDPPPPPGKSSSPNSAELIMMNGTAPPLVRDSSASSKSAGLRNLRNHFVRPVQVHDSTDKIPIEQYLGTLEENNINATSARHTDLDLETDHLSGDLRV